MIEILKILLIALGSIFLSAAIWLVWNMPIFSLQKVGVTAIIALALAAAVRRE